MHYYLIFRSDFFTELQLYGRYNHVKRNSFPMKAVSASAKSHAFAFGKCPVFIIYLLFVLFIQRLSSQLFFLKYLHSFNITIDTHCHWTSTPAARMLFPAPRAYWPSTHSARAAHMGMNWNEQYNISEWSLFIFGSQSPTWTASSQGALRRSWIVVNVCHDGCSAPALWKTWFHFTPNELAGRPLDKNAK